MKLALPVLLLIASSFVAQLAMAGANRGYWWDEAVYLGLAASPGNGYGLGADRMDAFRPPLFPFVIALPLMAGEWLVRLVVVLFGTAAVAMTYRVCKRMFDNKTGVIASLLLATNALFIFFSVRVLSETLGAMLMALALLFFVAAEKHKKGRMIYYGLAGLVLGAFFLAKYTAPLLLLSLLIYGAWKGRWRGMAVLSAAFAVMLAPWMYLSYAGYGNPFTAYATNWEAFQGGGDQPVYYFAAHFLEIFGPLGLFMLPGWYFMARRRNALLLLITAAPLVVFSLLGHKEVRYLMQFMPAYAMAAAYGITAVMAGRKKIYRKLLTAAVLVLSALSLVNGMSSVYAGADGGSAMTQASRYVALTTSANDTVMAQDYPYIFYIAQRNAALLPRSEAGLAGAARKAKYIIVDRFEPSNPSYVDGLEKTYVKIHSFSQWGDSDAVSVYRTWVAL